MSSWTRLRRLLQCALPPEPSASLPLAWRQPGDRHQRDEVGHLLVITLETIGNLEKPHFPAEELRETHLLARGTPVHRFGYRQFFKAPNPWFFCFQIQEMNAFSIYLPRQHALSWLNLRAELFLETLTIETLIQSYDLHPAKLDRSETEGQRLDRLHALA